MAQKASDEEVKLTIEWIPTAVHRGASCVVLANEAVEVERGLTSGTSKGAARVEEAVKVVEFDDSLAEAECIGCSTVLEVGDTAGA